MTYCQFLFTDATYRNPKGRQRGQALWFNLTKRDVRDVQYETADAFFADKQPRATTIHDGLKSAPHVYLHYMPYQPRYRLRHRRPIIIYHDAKTSLESFLEPLLAARLYSEATCAIIIYGPDANRIRIIEDLLKESHRSFINFLVIPSQPIDLIDNYLRAGLAADITMPDSIIAEAWGASIYKKSLSLASAASIPPQSFPSLQQLATRCITKNALDISCLSTRVALGYSYEKAIQTGYIPGQVSLVNNASPISIADVPGVPCDYFTECIQPTLGSQQYAAASRLTLLDASLFSKDARTAEYRRTTARPTV